MNARDKPKSIRMVILSALSDGAITTLDDLQIKVDEPRKKVLDNAVHAANDGLIKRLRDDVTGLAAYQITGDGRKYLAKFADGRLKEPVTEAVETAVMTPGVKADSPRVLDDEMKEKNEEIFQANRSLEASQGHIRSLNATIVQLGKVKASYSAEIDRLSKELADTKTTLELARLARTPPTPTGYVIQRPVKPLLRCSRLEKATERALSFAKGGSKAQVFALVPVGTAVPGAEWREGQS